MNLKVLRESKGYTQLQLASILGVTQQTIQKYETNKSEPDIASLITLADHFNVSVDYLIDHEPAGKDPNYAINEHEYSLIQSYRKLDATTRKSVDIILQSLAK
ncbi:MAG: helix-turn-helix domain-containing protein [Clostridiales bacterium]|nr:helix-turn-helix domain-containing protein [Clostridiales bacterium]